MLNAPDARVGVSDSLAETFAAAVTFRSSVLRLRAELAAIKPSLALLESARVPSAGAAWADLDALEELDDLVCSLDAMEAGIETRPLEGDARPVTNLAQAYATRVEVLAV